MVRILLKNIFLILSLLLFSIIFIFYLVDLQYLEEERNFYKNKIIQKKVVTTTNIFYGYKSFCISRPNQIPDWISNGIVFRMYQDNIVSEMENANAYHMLKILENSDKRVHIPSLHYDREKTKYVKYCYEINDQTCIYQEINKEQKNLHKIYIGGC